MLYRDHRSTLEESLATRQEITSMTQLVEHILKTFVCKSVSEPMITAYGYDERIKQFVSIVKVKFPGDEKYTPVGFVDGSIDI
jgi:uncharacterized Fe-S center protein